MQLRNILLITTAFAFIGCGSSDVSNNDIDLGGITPATEITEEACITTYPSIGYTANSDLFKSILTQDLSPSINPASIQMNHYIQEVQTNESFNPIIDYYLGNSQTPASLQLAADATASSPVEHIIIIRFMQDGPPPAE